ncbi:Unknown protein sequence [Pseudomonas syringae pv. castaneae]|uniref:Uncharacterized protein n=1 Tax=Pseudomonas syringae pv. castaneae TaxID=264450 RepID=A0A0P9PD55_PSESX|nr:Unknown protein sequence [Pseudomonas syringae pv. castaneae]
MVRSHKNLYQCNFMYKIFIAFFDELPILVVAGLDWSAQSQLSEMRTRVSAIAFKSA